MLLPFYSNSFAARVELSWDQNQEEELAGYYVHYGTSSRTYFENYFKLPKGSLLEEDGRVSCQFTVSLTPGMTCYFAVTAYDIWDFETDFSNEVQYPLQLEDEQDTTACDDPQMLQPVSITASSEFLPPFFAKEKLMDGDPRTFWSTIPSFSLKDEFVTLDFGEIKRVRWFNMYALDLFGIDFFPVNFNIQISRDNITWEELSTEEGYTPPLQPTPPDSWDFGSLECRYIRVYITKAKTLFFTFHMAQIAKIRVYPRYCS
jgi:hypothetical protein